VEPKTFVHEGKHIPIARKGESHHAAKLTADKVRQMRQLSWEYGLCTKCIAKMFEVKYATAWEAINLHTWKHV